MKHVKIATRNSPLALWQANFVKEQLEQIHEGVTVEIVGMTTQGDQMLDRSLAKVGGKGLFLKELEVSLLNGATDIAVHSMKDVPVELPQGLEIAVVCERENPYDAFVSNRFDGLESLPNNARVGTSSLRRSAQLKAAFPQLTFSELRGNVNTRLRKLDEGDYDAIILASAGLIRLGMSERIKQIISPSVCLPAVGQGIVGIECRSDDAEVKKLLLPMNNYFSEVCLAAERAINAELDGGCQVPVAGFAEVIGGQLQVRGLVARTDGSECLHAETISDMNADLDASVAVARTAGHSVAYSLLEQGAKKILQEVYDQSSEQDGLSANIIESIQKTEKESIVSTGPEQRATVLLTRKLGFLSNTLSIFETLGINAAHLLTIEIKPYFDKSKEEAFLEDMASIDDFVFVSRNAVEYGMKLIEQYGGLPATSRVLAVGKETARELSNYGVDALFPENGNGAEALMDVQPLEVMSGRNVLICRGLNGLSWLGNEMEARGAQASYLNCYEQSVPEEAEQKFQQLFVKLMEDGSGLNSVFLHSVQSASNLLVMATNKEHREILMQARAIVGSERIARFVRRKGWLGDVVLAKSPSNQDMMIANSLMS